MMILHHVFLGALWLVFCVLHSFLAGSSLKSELKISMEGHYQYYRLYYTLFAFLSLAAVVLFQIHIEQFEIFVPTLLTKIIAYIIGGSGLLLMLVCIKKYFISLSGLKSLFVDKPSPILIISGVHRFVRHPLYLGTFAFIWGLFLLFPYASLLIANCIITGYTLFGIRLEEKKLIAEFGQQYISYKQKVPALIPLSRRNNPGKAV